MRLTWRRSVRHKVQFSFQIFPNLRLSFLEPLRPLSDVREALFRGFGSLLFELYDVYGLAFCIEVAQVLEKFVILLGCNLRQRTPQNSPSRLAQRRTRYADLKSSGVLNSSGAGCLPDQLRVPDSGLYFVKLPC